MALTEAKIQALIKQREHVSNDTLKAAINETIEEAQKRQKEGLKVAIVAIRKNTEAAVDQLRHVRKQEEEAKNRLDVYNAAEEAFNKDANVEAYAKSIWPKDQSAQDRFLASFRGTLLTN
jgi:outer membrane PBP1 activator LpoA protein